MANVGGTSSGAASSRIPKYCFPRGTCFRLPFAEETPYTRGFKGIPRMFRPISGVRTEVTNPEVRDIPKVGIHSFNLVPVGPSSVHGGTPLSIGDLVGTLSLFPTPTFDLPETLVADYLETCDKGLLDASSSPQTMVVLSNSSSSCESDLLEAEVDLRFRQMCFHL
ncbi:hypothetical protein CJ030_MR4G010566 [Morella rubra]|uniref:Uncharacterized protein n=1 Tax=Morella rubra TaxID=262757 RepID=A0A6A1VRJ0_9ROSI|nr:hypothetical protein CJ030_MR4G010566 [Morella rubra]